tara:strand:- start:449 stop:943 length:495 start_codon:yes stop_codon:yes gene_type:complete
MSNKKRLVLAELKHIYNIEDYYSLNPDERELISLQFMLSFNNTDFVEKAVPSLAALISLGKTRLIVIDGWEEPVFFKCRMALAALINMILPHEVTNKLLKSQLLYIKEPDEIEKTNRFIAEIDIHKSEGYEIINLSNTTWASYAQSEFPDLFTKTTGEEPTTLN